jgi:chromosome segregation ATPase
MAIKTKKIEDLGGIKLTDVKSLETNDIMLVGSKSGITGKISTSELVKVVCDSFDKKLSKIKNSEKTVAYDDTEITQKVTDVSVKLNTTNTLVTQQKTKLENTDKKIKDLEKRITALENKVSEISYLEEKLNKVEKFIKDLQKGSYLSTNDIKTAANACFPVDTIVDGEKTDE